MKNPQRPGRWKAGESGNPAGRKPGIGAVAKIRASMAEHIPALVAVLLERAKAGDIGAARLLLERTTSAMPRALPVIVPATTTDAELDALRRRGVDAWRECDPDFFDLFL